MGNSKLTLTEAARAKLTMADILTTILAASSRLSQARIRRFEAAISAFASSTFVPNEKGNKEKSKFMYFSNCFMIG